MPSIPVGTNLWCKNDGFIEDCVHTNGVYVVCETPEGFWDNIDTELPPNPDDWVFIEDDNGDVNALNYDRVFHPYNPEKPVFPWRADFRRWEEIKAKKAMRVIHAEWLALGINLIESSSLDEDQAKALKAYLAPTWGEEGTG